MMVCWHRIMLSKRESVTDGEIRVSLREPEEKVRLRSGAIFAVRPGRPHRVTNGGDRAATFLNLQRGEYDFVPQS
jgi:quercetin dioxygenase-like cupin family protein